MRLTQPRGRSRGTPIPAPGGVTAPRGTALRRPAVVRRARARHYAMCPPTWFTDDPARGAAAAATWEGLRGTLLGLGHRVSLVPPRPDLPGMVFAAQAATVVAGRVLGARFRAAERSEEGPAYLRWFADRGYDARLEPIFAHEGGTDLLPAGRVLLAASAPHTEAGSHAEARAFLGRPVVPLELVDPRFPGLASALTVLGGRAAAYFPGAFSAASRRTLARLFAELVEVAEDEALALGLDAVSDGRHVVLPATAPGLARRLSARGFATTALDMTPFAAAGAGVRSCVLDLGDNRYKS